MADYIVRDNSGSIVGRISESGPSCMGCMVLSLIIGVVSAAVGIYQVVQKRLANNRIEAQRIVLANDILDSYTGEYKYARYKIKIERRGDKLFNKSPEEFCELVPISTQEFVYARCVNGFQGRARFARDSRGNVTLIVVHRDGREEHAQRK